jgi:NADH-quinone oxidoreductase subunit J
MVDSLFYIFAALTLSAALFVVASRNPVNSAMGMILALVGVAANFFLLDAPFLGVLQILVYAGSVMVLFVFIIMLFDVERIAGQPLSWWSVGASVVALGSFGGIAWWLINNPSALPDTPLPAPPPVLPGAENPSAYATGAKAFGYSLLSKYMLPLQLAGFLLLTAMIGVVSLSKKAKS